MKRLGTLREVNRKFIDKINPDNKKTPHRSGAIREGDEESNPQR